MMEIAVDFYKNLFKKENRDDISLEENFWGEEDLVTNEENDFLEKPFSEEEIKEAVFGSYAEGAPGPDGLPFLFYQTFWEVIKGDLCKMFDAMFANRLDFY